MFYQLCEDSGLPESDAARAYTVAREVFSLRDLWNGISEMKSAAPEVQKELFLEIQILVERASIWFMRNMQHPIKVTETINDYKKGVKTISDSLTSIRLPHKSRFLNRALQGIRKPRFQKAWHAALQVLIRSLPLVILCRLRAAPSCPLNWLARFTLKSAPS